MRTRWVSLAAIVFAIGCASPTDDAVAQLSIGRGSSSASSSVSPQAAKKPPASQSLYEKLLFYPAKFPAGNWQPEGLVWEDVALTAGDGTRLHAWFCPCESPRAVLLYTHGNGGNVSFDAGLFRLLQKELRVATLAIDYRGYGRSEGLPTVVGVLDDARSARAWLAKRTNVAESSIVLMGRSLGGAVAVQLVADAKPRGLILESTFSSLKAAATHHFPRLAWLVPADQLNSAATLAKFDGQLLQSHGDADRTIPFAQGEALYLTAKGRKQFIRIAGGDHNDPQPAEYYRQLDKFIAELP